MSKSPYLTSGQFRIWVIVMIILLSILAYACVKLEEKYHLGAPALPVMNCPSPSVLLGHWFRDGDPQLKAFAGDPESVHWLGWTEVGGCGMTVNFGVGTSG
jgi:hypothetical protein